MMPANCRHAPGGHLLLPHSGHGAGIGMQLRVHSCRRQLRRLLVARAGVQSEQRLVVSLPLLMSSEHPSSTPCSAAPQSATCSLRRGCVPAELPARLHGGREAGPGQHARRARGGAQAGALVITAACAWGPPCRWRVLKGAAAGARSSRSSSLPLPSPACQARTARFSVPCRLDAVCTQGGRARRLAQPEVSAVQAMARAPTR